MNRIEIETDGDTMAFPVWTVTEFDPQGDVVVSTSWTSVTEALDFAATLAAAIDQGNTTEREL